MVDNDTINNNNKDSEETEEERKKRLRSERNRRYQTGLKKRLKLDEITADGNEKLRGSNTRQEISAVNLDDSCATKRVKEIINLASPSSNVSGFEMMPASLHTTKSDNLVDLLNCCSPGIDNRFVVKLHIRNNFFQNQNFANSVMPNFLSRSDMLLQRSEVTSVFREKCLATVSTLESIKQKGKRVNSHEHAINMVLLLSNDDNSRYTMEGTIAAQDIYALLKCEAFISDAPINYYRCLLIREELNQTLTYTKSTGERSWIHTTVFMERLMNHGGYNAVKQMDRRYIGK